MDYQADAGRRKQSRGRCFCAALWKRIWAVLAVAVIVSCIVAIVSLRLVGSPSPVVSDPPSDPTKVPSPSGSDLVDRRRYIMFRSALARVSEPSAFVNPNSPQSQALQWLVYQDKTIKIPDAQEGMNVSQFLYSDKIAGGDFHSKLVQRYALMVLAFSTDGASWRGMEPWEELVDTDECHSVFQGVGCDPVSGRVTVVDLDYKKLSGQIPDEIGLLTDLTYLNLSRNQLEGRIPHILYKKLTNLEQLALADNEIAFTLSNDIGKLTALHRLVLSSTYLSGTLPESMKNLTSLRELDLYNTRLSGSFLQYAENWRNIENLSLEINQAITGTIPSEIGLCTNLHTFKWDTTQISGSLPTEIGLLSNLVEMMGGGEQMTGTIPSEIGLCTKITHMVVGAAPLITGSLPSTIGQLSALKYLAITGTSMGGSLPSELGLLTDLLMLNFENNLFGGEVPGESFVNMEALTSLQINSNFLSGTIPQELCEKTSMIVWLDCKGDLVCENDCCPGVWCTFG